MNLFKIMCNGILHNFYSWIIKLCVFFKTHSAVYKYLYHKKKDISETEGGEETSLMSGLAGRGWGTDDRKGLGQQRRERARGQGAGGRYSQCMSRSCSYSMKA